uniref:Uncharacterized protein n=1 Tax=Glossina brevipalpis TaxID=37001 RepID=A0A1A9WNR4_9MUSC
MTTYALRLVDWLVVHCSLLMPQIMRYAFRPPENCEFCKQVKHMERVRGISVEEFTEKYAYTGRPVIVEDATQNWTALEKFNYWYFHDVYYRAKNKEKVIDCQFLPYKTGFRDLYEALDMPSERVEFYKDQLKGEESQKEPWYFGWSNCNSETAEEFRQHYGRPYFLPEISESSAIDWFFMGTEGLGAQMHVKVSVLGKHYTSPSEASETKMKKTRRITMTNKMVTEDLGAQIGLIRDEEGTDKDAHDAGQ